MKSRKILTALMAVTLAASMTACADNGDNEKNTDTTATKDTSADVTTTTTVAPVTTEKPATSINERNGEEYVLIEDRYRKLSDTNAYIAFKCKPERLDVTFDNLRKLSEDTEIEIFPSNDDNYPYEKLAQAVSHFNKVTLNWSNSDDLTPVQYFTTASSIMLDNCTATDFSPIQHLTNLTRLDLSNTAINDLSSIGNLINLTGLYLGDNIINDVTVFYNLVNLNSLEFTIADNYLEVRNYTKDDYAVMEGLKTTSDTYNVIADNEDIKTLYNKLANTKITINYSNEYTTEKG